MNESLLRSMIEQVRAGRTTRRAFIEATIGLGLTAPWASHLLGAAGVASAEPPRPSFVPSRRGGGGELKILMWDAPTLLHPHFGRGLRDFTASRIFYEPLAAAMPDGTFARVLAEEIPTLANGGIAPDGMSVTWKLKRGVVWHDGAPFTADDVIFNWEFAVDPATTASSRAGFQGVARIDKLDLHTVKVVFAKPQPYWDLVFTGGGLLPRHVFARYKGAGAREAVGNVKAVGTGPYRLVDFKPGDLIRAEINPNYHVPNRPFFDRLEIKGGGDAISAARAVLQTGEYDFAYYILAEEELLKRVEQGSKGRIVIVPGAGVSHIQCNQTDPWREVDGERSSVRTTHPSLSDLTVRRALNLLVDRGTIQDHLVGRSGRIADNFLVAPDRCRSTSNTWEFNVDKAGRFLDEVGWAARRGRDPQPGWSAAQARLPGRRRGDRAEDSGRGQAGRGSSWHRGRGQGRAAGGLLLLGHEQSRHQRALPRRPADVHGVRQPGSPVLHGPVRLVGDPHAGQQVDRAQPHALAQRRVRPSLARGRQRDGSRQARGAVHPHERHGRAGQRGDPDHPAQHPARDLPPARGLRAERVGLDLRQHRLLVPPRKRHAGAAEIVLNHLAEDVSR